MGKTGKWIKTLLLGKKTSKSNSSKGRDFLKSANKRETLVSSKVPMSGMIVDSPSMLPVLVGTEAKNGADSEKGVAAELTTDDGILSSANEDANSQTFINLSSLGDPERTRLEHAAIKAQAAFRGYAARRAFRTLKGIVRLQALIRGRLVRRQAVATLRCVWGIVKLQALARGQKDSKSFGINTCMKAENLRKKALCRKLLASSPTAMPLSHHCGSGEPNSAWEWLERWTMSRFWEPLSQPKKNLVSKPQKTEPVRPKRSVRKPSNANSENGSIRSTSVSEKPNRNLKKISSHSVGPVQEHPQNEIEKVKRNSRRFSNPTKEVSDELEHDNEKPKHSLRKAPSSTAHNVSEQGNSDSAEQMKDTAVEVLKRSGLETSEKLAAADGEVDELHKHPAADLQPMENNVEVENNQEMNELNSKVGHISNENQKTSQRRASLPTKIDHQENELHSTPRLPSYMAPTESAKARLRRQGSPKLVEDEVENNSVTRRHSLPSSTNGKLSSLSPRVQSLVQATGKGVVRSDRSLMSSRDGGDKVVQAEWRR